VLQLDDPDLPDGWQMDPTWRFARQVGPENVIAGTDCGLGWRVGHPEIAWAKLAALVEGARLASRELWGSG
jgi:5-methyltetrahydropteroyltriglutamate--homocysteine methyltransferase